MSIGLPGVHPVGDLLCLARRGEDGALVGAQHFEPGGDVAGVVGSWLNTEVEVGADHGAEKLDRAFFHGVGGRAEPSGEIAVEAILGAGSVAAFVEQHGVVGNRVPEASELGHLHVILGRDVASL